MPKKRRNRKHKRYHFTNIQNEDKENESKIKQNVMDIQTVKLVASPLQMTNNLHLNEVILNNTPVNKTKVLNRCKYDNFSYNCTNLNFLFNEYDNDPSDIVNDLAGSILDKSIPCTNYMNKSTLLNNEIKVKNYNNIMENMICETPKISQIERLDCNVDPLNIPLCTSSPLYPDKLTKNNINKEINNKAYKELELFNNVIQSTTDLKLLKFTPQSVDKSVKNDITPIITDLDEIKTVDVEEKVDTNNISTNKKSRTNSLNTSENFLHNVSGKFINKIKKLHKRFSSNWIGRIVAFCTWFSITNNKKDSNLDEEEKECEYHEAENKWDKIISLISESNKQTKENSELLENLNVKCDDIQKQLHVMFKEFEDYKKLASSTPIFTPIPAAPPPPPPLPLFNSTPINNIQITKSNQIKNIETIGRPSITVDALREVKLKKISHRPSLLIRTKTEPIISKEVLKQIKLKPTNFHRIVPKFDKMLNEEELNISPISNLAKITGCNAIQGRRLRKSSHCRYNNYEKYLQDRERSNF